MRGLSLRASLSGPSWMAESSASTAWSFVTDCEHFGFRLHYEAGYGSWGRCHDCGVEGRGHPIVKTAMDNFESRVGKARRYEKKNKEPAPSEMRRG